MASKRHVRLKQCKGKQRHPTRTKAVAHVIQLSRTKGQTVHAYRCRFCGGWHVGH